jgi:hypothetical protein
MRVIAGGAGLLRGIGLVASVVASGIQGGVGARDQLVAGFAAVEGRQADAHRTLGRPPVQADRDLVKPGAGGGDVGARKSTDELVASVANDTVCRP